MRRATSTCTTSPCATSTRDNASDRATVAVRDRRAARRCLVRRYHPCLSIARRCHAVRLAGILSLRWPACAQRRRRSRRVHRWMRNDHNVGLDVVQEVIHVKLLERILERVDA